MQIHLSHAFKSKLSVAGTVTSFLWLPLAILNIYFNMKHVTLMTICNSCIPLNGLETFLPRLGGEYEYSGVAGTCASILRRCIN